jgi:hypothetical protein
MRAEDMTRKVLAVFVLTTLAGIAEMVLAQGGPIVVVRPIGKQHLVGKVFEAQISNELSVPITMCTDFGSTVGTDSGRTVAPNPFMIQKWTGREWDIQLLGSDVGADNTAISIDAHETKKFRLQLNGPGRYRLQLTFLKGEIDAKSPLSQKDAVTVESNPFEVLSPPR